MQVFYIPRNGLILPGPTTENQLIKTEDPPRFFPSWLQARTYQLTNLSTIIGFLFTDDSYSCSPYHSPDTDHKWPFCLMSAITTKHGWRSSCRYGPSLHVAIHDHPFSTIENWPISTNTCHWPILTIISTSISFITVDMIDYYDLSIDMMIINHYDNIWCYDNNTTHKPLHLTIVIPAPKCIEKSRQGLWRIVGASSWAAVSILCTRGSLFVHG